MTSLYLKGGKLIVADGKLATSQACCCQLCCNSLCCDMLGLDLTISGFVDSYILEYTTGACGVEVCLDGSAFIAYYKEQFTYSNINGSYHLTPTYIGGVFTGHFVWETTPCYTGPKVYYREELNCDGIAPDTPGTYKKETYLKKIDVQVLCGATPATLQMSVDSPIFTCQSRQQQPSESSFGACFTGSDNTEQIDLCTTGTAHRTDAITVATHCSDTMHNRGKQANYPVVTPCTMHITPDCVGTLLDWDMYGVLT